MRRSERLCSAVFGTVLRTTLSKRCVASACSLPKSNNVIATPSPAKSSLVDWVLQRPPSPNPPLVALAQQCTDKATQQDIFNIKNHSAHDLMQFLRNESQKEQRLVIWKAVALRAQQLVPLFSPSDAVNLLFTFSLQRLRDENLIAQLLSHLTRSLHTLDAPALSYCLSSLARLNIRDDAFFKQASKQVALRAAEMSPRDLSEIAFAYGHLRYFHFSLHNVLRAHVVQRIQKFQPRDLTLLLQSLKTLKLRDTPLIASVLGQVNRMLPQFSGDELVVVLNSYATFDIRHPLTLQLLDDALQQKYLDLKPFNVGLGLMSMSRLKKGYDWGFLATCLVDKATTEGKYYSLDSISLVVCGASRLIRYCPTLKTRVTPLLTSLGRRIGELAPHLTPSIVTVAVYGFMYSLAFPPHIAFRCQAAVHYGPLFYHAPIHITRHIKEYTPDQLGLVVKGFSMMNIYHSSLLEAVASQLPRFYVSPLHYPLRDETLHWMEKRGYNSHTTPTQESTPELSQREKPFVHIQSLLWFLRAMAQFQFCDDKILQNLAGQLTLRSKELNASECVSCILSFLALHRCDAVLFEALVDHVVTAWNAYQTELEAITYEKKIKRNRTKHKHYKPSSSTGTLDHALFKNVSESSTKPRVPAPITKSQACKLAFAMEQARMSVKNYFPSSLIHLTHRSKRSHSRSLAAQLQRRTSTVAKLIDEPPTIKELDEENDEENDDDFFLAFATPHSPAVQNSDLQYAVHKTRHCRTPPRHIDRINWDDWNFAPDHLPTS